MYPTETQPSLTSGKEESSKVYPVTLFLLNLFDFHISAIFRYSGLDWDGAGSGIDFLPYTWM